MGKTEGMIEKYLVHRVKSAGGRCYKFSASITNGVPDRIIVLGKSVFVETKAPNGRLRKLQAVRHDEIRESGGEVYLISSKRQVDELVDALIAQRTATAKEGKKED